MPDLRGIQCYIFFSEISEVFLDSDITKCYKNITVSKQLNKTEGDYPSNGSLDIGRIR